MTTTTNFKKAGSRTRSLALEALCTLMVFLMASETWGYTINRQRHKELTYWERCNLETSRQIRLQKEQEIQRKEEEQIRKMEQRESEAKSRVAQTRQEGGRILDETFPYIQEIQDAYHFATRSIKDWTETTGEEIPDDLKARGAKYRATAMRLESSYKNLSGLVQSTDVAAAETLRQIQSLKSEAVSAARDGERLCTSVIDLYVSTGQADLQEIGERIKHVSADLDWSRATADPETFAELDATRKELLRKREACGTALSTLSAGGGYGAEDAEWDARFRTVQEQLSKIETLEADVESFAVQVAALSGNGKKNSPQR